MYYVTKFVEQYYYTIDNLKAKYKRKLKYVGCKCFVFDRKLKQAKMGRSVATHVSLKLLNYDYYVLGEDS